MSRLWWLAGMALVVDGCATPMVLMQGPNGEIVNCSGYAQGFAGSEPIGAGRGLLLGVDASVKCAML